MNFYIKVERINGLRMITGCTDNREYAINNWGLGAFSKVIADNSHEIKAESIRQGFTDPVYSATPMFMPVAI